MGPLYELLRAKSKWNWSKIHDNAFNCAKKSLTSSEVLMYYNTQLPVKVTCYASPIGIGAVISHFLLNGVERPVAYTSRTLSSAEKNYSQLDKEALALVYGVKEFHKYLFGRHFTLETDHRPLIYIFGNKKKLPQMAASRVQRWCVFLSGYDYEIKFIKRSKNKNADCLSRLRVETK